MILITATHAENSDTPGIEVNGFRVQLDPMEVLLWEFEAAPQARPN